jgi:hypothetical protein
MRGGIHTAPQAADLTVGKSGCRLRYPWKYPERPPLHFLTPADRDCPRLHVDCNLPPMARKIATPTSDVRRIKSSGNVFVDLGFDPVEAKAMALRAEEMIGMEQRRKARVRIRRRQG